MTFNTERPLFTDLPAPGSIAAELDLSARFRVFDTDGRLAALSRATWDAIAGDVKAISTAYWQQWQSCFDDARTWAPHDVERMIDVGCAFLENRFLRASGPGSSRSSVRSRPPTRRALRLWRCCR